MSKARSPRAVVSSTIGTRAAVVGDAWKPRRGCGCPSCDRDRDAAAVAATPAVAAVEAVAAAAMDEKECEAALSLERREARSIFAQKSPQVSMEGMNHSIRNVMPASLRGRDRHAALGAVDAAP